MTRDQENNRRFILFSSKTRITRYFEELYRSFYYFLQNCLASFNVFIVKNRYYLFSFTFLLLDIIEFFYSFLVKTFTRLWRQYLSKRSPPRAPLSTSAAGLYLYSPATCWLWSLTLCVLMIITIFLFSPLT